jgi:DNA gyrase subunit A
MSKKIDNENDKEIANYNSNIIVRDIGEACTEYMKIFGANNNLMRHIPSLIDGLKPGERRIIYAMYKELNADYKSSFKKVSAIIGQTLFYHPHGETPIGETISGLAQPWNNVECLLEGSGNFGSALGDSAGAYRYIEARLSYYCYKCFFEEFDPTIVDMKPNYLGDRTEPEYLPAKYPNILINNVFGIGYGISTGLPPYNLQEVLELTLKLIDDPDYSEFTLIPDSPTGAYIIDEGEFKQISETGKGKFKMRGVIEIDEENNALIIKNAPLRVSLDKIKINIINLFKENKIQGIKYIDDKTKLNKVKIIIYLKKEVDPITIMHSIYSKTDMEKTFSVNFKVIDDYEDFDYNIKSLLLLWIDYRREIKRSYFNHKLLEKRERQHILETLIFITNSDNGENTMRIIKKSENKKEIITRLMESYKISSLQAINIADMPIHRFSKEAHREYIKEKETIDDNIRELEKIVRSVKKIDKYIKQELEEGIKIFGKPRNSEVINIDGEVKIRDTNHHIVFTLNGFVKKLSDECTSIGFINQGDYPIEIIEARNTTDLLIFDETGKISKLPVYSLINTELNNEGEKLNKYCKINGKINTIIPKPTDDVLSQVKLPIYFLMITKNGILKKTLSNHYTNIKNELLGMIVKEKDELRAVKLLAGDKDIVIYTNKGYGVRISSTEVKETSRMSIGVKSIDLTENEEVIGLELVNEKDKYLFMITNKGNCKKSKMDAFKTMDRNSKPLRLIALEDDEEVLTVKTIKGNEKFKAFLKNSIEEIDVENVIELPRLSKGRKLIGVRKGEVIIDIKEVKNI